RRCARLVEDRPRLHLHAASTRGRCHRRGGHRWARPHPDDPRRTMTRILLVEDEASYRDPLAYRLGREGYEVVEAADGNQALASFDDTVDLVLLDLMLPGLSGLEVCRELRATSTVPIIMLTAKDEEIDKVVGLELGADD